MRELFYDNTEEIINILWNLSEKIYGLNSNDLLEEIYKDKSDNNQKKFPSQIINPNTDSKSGKPLFNSAIDRVRDDKRRDDRRDNNKRHRDDRYQRDREDRRKGSREEYSNFRTMKVGDKQIVIKKKQNNKSRSSSPNEKRERSREREDQEKEPREQKEYPQQQRNNQYEKEYYPRGYPYKERGFYPMRGRFSRGGRFASMFMPPIMFPRRYV